MITVSKHGWPVQADRVLAACVPEGYELRENEDRVFLYCGDRLVAQFSAVTPLSDLVRAVHWEVSQNGRAD